MLKSPSFAALFASIYLLIYVLFLQLDIFANLSAILFFCSPVVLIWLAYTVIRYGRYEGEELKEDEEWGYQDKSREQLS